MDTSRNIKFKRSVFIEVIEKAIKELSKTQQTRWFHREFLPYLQKSDNPNVTLEKCLSSIFEMNVTLTPEADTKLYDLKILYKTLS